MMRFLIYLLSTGFLFACSAGKKKNLAETEGVNNLIPKFQYSTTPCFGFCPVYEIRVLRDGSLHYFAKRFIHPTGAFKGNLSENQERRYLNLVKQIDWDTVPERYETRIADAPGAKFIYEDSISTFGTVGIPEGLRQLGYFFDSLRVSVEWERVDSLGAYMAIQKNNAAYAYFNEGINPDKLPQKEAFLKQAQLIPVSKDNSIRLIELYNSDLDYEAIKDMLMKKDLASRVEPVYELKKKVAPVTD